MDATQVAVTAGGAVLLGLVFWFFLGPRRATAARLSGGVQEVEVVVRGGYTPDRIEVRQGRPVRLTFVRRESNPGSARVGPRQLHGRDLRSFRQPRVRRDQRDPGRW